MNNQIEGRIVDVSELQPDMSPVTYPHTLDRITRMMIAVLASSNENKVVAVQTVLNWNKEVRS